MKKTAPDGADTQVTHGHGNSMIESASESVKIKTGLKIACFFMVGDFIDSLVRITIGNIGQRAFMLRRRLLINAYIFVRHISLQI